MFPELGKYRSNFSIRQTNFFRLGCCFVLCAYVLRMRVHLQVPTRKVQQIVNSKPEQELAKLRAYMNRHRQEVNDLLQGSVHYDSIKSTIGRFQNGAHNGRAYDDDDGEATGVARGGLIWRLLGYLIVMLAVGALAVYTANKFPF